MGLVSPPRLCLGTAASRSGLYYGWDGSHRCDYGFSKTVDKGQAKVNLRICLVNYGYRF